MNNMKSGPPDDFHVPFESFGKIILSKLKEKNQDEISLIELNENNKKISYGELLRLSINLAINLKKLGIKKDDVIVITSQNNWKFAVILLSTFYIGATLNPLNPDYLEGELEHAFTISQPKLVIYSQKTLNKIQKLQKKFDCIENIICLDEKRENGIKNNSKVLFEENNIDFEQYQAEEVDPKEQVGLIMSSSGTTGLPKGVMITHSNMRTSMLGCSCFNLIEEDITMSYLPFFHVFGAALTIACILFGTKCIIMEKFSPEPFLQAIQTYKVTKLFTVPPILKFLVQTPLMENYDISSIKDIICGAAPVSKNVVEMLVKRCKIDSVGQIYGLTETSGPATYMQPNLKKYASVGSPTVSNVMKVIDVDTKKSVGANQLGEICVKGGGLMKGYLRNAEETQSAFDSDGFLKTGDYGYYDEEGDFYIIDRLKEVIKCKGFQVPPAELENILIKHPAVKDVGVVGKADERSGEVPVAFIVKEINSEITETELIDYVANNVSFQKQLHGGVRFVEQIPKNASGKILRRVLRKAVEDEDKINH